MAKDSGLLPIPLLILQMHTGEEKALNKTYS